MTDSSRTIPTPAKPWTDPADWRRELEDIDAFAADLFAPGTPLRDRVATLAAQWQDVAASLDSILPSSDYIAQLVTMRQRAGIA